jgi:hypothetical protein
VRGRDLTVCILSFLRQKKPKGFGITVLIQVQQEAVPDVHSGCPLQKGDSVRDSLYVTLWKVMKLQYNTSQLFGTLAG